MLERVIFNSDAGMFFHETYQRRNARRMGGKVGGKKVENVKDLKNKKKLL